MTVSRIEKHCDDFSKICTTNNSTDTVYKEIYKTVYKDTIVYDTIYLPGDTVYISTSIDSIQAGNNLISDLNFSHAEVSFKDNRIYLYHYDKDTTLALQIHLKNAIVERDYYKALSTNTTNTITVKENTVFARFTIWYFIISIISVIVYIIIKLKVWRILL